ncbi:MAG: hypothetical protein KGO82_19400, partial [Bacteroidota bacterium]|nr:hypothetical protein [Bacteroidota bacterium]
MATDLVYEKQFLLMHEILESFKKTMIIITKSGNEKSGMIPIYELLSTPKLHFGMVVALLNNPQDFKPNGAELDYYSKTIPVEKQIKTYRYGYEE